MSSDAGTYSAGVRSHPARDEAVYEGVCLKQGHRFEFLGTGALGFMERQTYCVQCGESLEDARGRA